MENIGRDFIAKAESYDYSDLWGTRTIVDGWPFLVATSPIRDLKNLSMHRYRDVIMLRVNANPTR